MTHAYREIYLSNAQSVLGDAFDYAINTCQIPGDDFVKLFNRLADALEVDPLPVPIPDGQEQAILDAREFVRQGAMENVNDFSGERRRDFERFCLAMRGQACYNTLTLERRPLE